MPKYIDADAFEVSARRRYCDPCRKDCKDYHGLGCRACWVDDMLGEVDDAPAADVEPVKHGRWIPHPGHHDFDLCSVCGTGVRRRIYEDGGEIEYNYKICPWCGAKMLPEPPKMD